MQPTSVNCVSRVLCLKNSADTTHIVHKVSINLVFIWQNLINAFFSSDMVLTLKFLLMRRQSIASRGEGANFAGRHFYRNIGPASGIKWFSQVSKVKHAAYYISLESWELLIVQNGPRYGRDREKRVDVHLAGWPAADCRVTRDRTNYETASGQRGPGVVFVQQWRCSLKQPITWAAAT